MSEKLPIKITIVDEDVPEALRPWIQECEDMMNERIDKVMEAVVRGVTESMMSGEPLTPERREEIIYSVMPWLKGG